MDLLIFVLFCLEKVQYIRDRMLCRIWIKGHVLMMYKHKGCLIKETIYFMCNPNDILIFVPEFWFLVYILFFTLKLFSNNHVEGVLKL